MANITYTAASAASATPNLSLGNKFLSYPPNSPPSALPKAPLILLFPPHPLSNPFFANIFFLSSPAMAKIALWLRLCNHQHGTWPWRNPPLESSVALFDCHFPPDGICVYAQMVVRTSDYGINERNLGNFMNDLFVMR
ncbi:hypothetical protein ERO13_A12G239350v2 [Gossypium hirsutum]|uniref:Uncharacterized protein n=2 Tax=Gossypium TaxID=3633 RepID=A0A5D2WYX2_GOSMU|nr:hypothetical protein ERO13_A12G239350v2 [Gossypium hirsutum]TYH97902.1 hypothetical protein ES332_A12G272600v1 [Gossypium tomentosum]TYJ06814.1 hypothetical protein E1A91_A12G260800v1 [Gossypium mustelinum]